MFHILQNERTVCDVQVRRYGIMDIIYWNDLVTRAEPFPNGAALSIGGFDGPHRGHALIFASVLAVARQYGIPAGLITFVRSPRSLKAGKSYAGDVSTLEMRLRKFAEQGFSFTVLIDFSVDFAKMTGTVFFDILMKTICIKYLAVGSDFTCGYRHDTGVRELQLLAQEKGFCFDSIEQLNSAQHERISSSAIRKAVEHADFTLAENLLGYPFFLDVATIVQQESGAVYSISRAAIGQILPMNGLYSARAYIQTGDCFSVQVKIMETVIEISIVAGSACPRTAGTSIHKLEFIQKE